MNSDFTISYFATTSSWAAPPTPLTDTLRKSLNFSIFSSIKHEVLVIYMISQILYSAFCVCKNTPELVRRRRRSHESYKADLWVYLKNKNQLAFMAQGNVVGIVAIEMQV